MLEPDLSPRRRQRQGVGGLGDIGGELQDAGQLLEGRGGRLERVVELRDLGHRLEELAQVEQEGRQRPDGDVALIGAPAAVEQHDADGDVADEPDPRHEPGDQPERGEVGPAVLVVDVVEDLLVARLATEGLDRANATHRLDEVHDDECDLLSRDPIGLRRLATEPVGQPGEERPAEQCDESQPQVERQQDHGGADQGEPGSDKSVEPGLEHLVDRVDVGGLPGDHPAGGVSVVEGDAESLEVVEDPTAQDVEDGLADPALHDQEAVARDRLGDRGADEHGDHHDHRPEVVTLGDRRDPGVDAHLHEVRDGQPGHVLHQDEADQHHQGPAVRRQQLAQQPP